MVNRNCVKTLTIYTQNYIILIGASKLKKYAYEYLFLFDSNVSYLLSLPVYSVFWLLNTIRFKIAVHVPDPRSTIQ